MTPADLAEIRKRHAELAGFSNGELCGQEHDDRGALLDEVDRLREGIRRFRVSQGRHLVRCWADHLDDLVAPDPVWKEYDDMCRDDR